jgi:hypothetical protein
MRSDTGISSRDEKRDIQIISLQLGVYENSNPLSLYFKYFIIFLHNFAEN